MMVLENGPSCDFPEYNARTAEVWDRLADWWDDEIGDGNPFEDLLIEPATERLLALQPGERVLDIACGAGRFAQRMVTLGAEVVAIDQSKEFIRRAKQRTADSAREIDYRTLDATDSAALLSLGEAGFDAAVCTMALMDMASIDPLISTLPRLLKPGGRFVFSVTHPAFNSGTARKIAEEHDRDGSLKTTYGVAITDYASPYVHMGVGVPGQPAPQPFFHRSISMLFNVCFQRGFVLNGVEEPTLPEGTESSTPLAWANLPSIPPVLVARMANP